MDYESFLGVEPVFTGSELVAYLAECGEADPFHAARRLEEGWVRAGRVVVVRPGLFAVVADGIDPARFQPMPTLVATKMAPDAVVSHHLALDHWGISYSLWFDAVVWSDTPRSADRDATDLPAANRSRALRRKLGGYRYGMRPLPYGSAHHLSNMTTPENWGITWPPEKLGHHLSLRGNRGPSPRQYD